MTTLYLLWLIDKPDITEDLHAVVQRHTAKFGLLPNVIYFNPLTLPGGMTDFQGIPVKLMKTVLKRHIMVGAEG